MALENETLLKALLACSESHRAQPLAQPLGCSPRTGHIKLWICQVYKSIRDIIGDEHHTTFSDWDLAIALLLTSMNIMFGDFLGTSTSDWKMHLEGARNIIKMSLRSTCEKSCTTYFVARWFIYLDVIGRISNCQPKALVGNPNDCRAHQYIVQYDDTLVDAMFGCSYQHFQILRNISLLIQQTDNLPSSQKDLHILASKVVYSSRSLIDLIDTAGDIPFMDSTGTQAFLYACLALIHRRIPKQMISNYQPGLEIWSSILISIDQEIAVFLRHHSAAMEGSLTRGPEKSLFPWVVLGLSGYISSSFLEERYKCSLAMQQVSQLTQLATTPSNASAQFDRPKNLLARVKESWESFVANEVLEHG